MISCILMLILAKWETEKSISLIGFARKLFSRLVELRFRKFVFERFYAADAEEESFVVMCS